MTNNINKKVASDMSLLLKTARKITKNDLVSEAKKENCCDCSKLCDSKCNCKGKCKECSGCKKKKAEIEKVFQTLNKISECLDSAGLNKSAQNSIKLLENIIKEAKDVSTFDEIENDFEDEDELGAEIYDLDQDTDSEDHGSHISYEDDEIESDDPEDYMIDKIDKARFYESAKELNDMSGMTTTDPRLYDTMLFGPESFSDEAFEDLENEKKLQRRRMKKRKAASSNLNKKIAGPYDVSNLFNDSYFTSTDIDLDEEENFKDKKNNKYLEQIINELENEQEDEEDKRLVRSLDPSEIREEFEDEDKYEREYDDEYDMEDLNFISDNLAEETRKLFKHPAFEAKKREFRAFERENPEEYFAENYPDEDFDPGFSSFDSSIYNGLQRINPKAFRPDEDEMPTIPPTKTGPSRLKWEPESATGLWELDDFSLPTDNLDGLSSELDNGPDTWRDDEPPTQKMPKKLEEEIKEANRQLDKFLKSFAKKEKSKKDVDEEDDEDFEDEK